MTTKTYKGKTYGIGKLYEFSYSGSDWNRRAVLGDILQGRDFPFVTQSGTVFKFCREINPDLLGKITKVKIEPEVGKYYKMSSGYVAQWEENFILCSGEEIICEMVEKA